MEKRLTLLFILLFCVIKMISIADIININDGASHTIDDYQSNDIYLDYETPNDPGTHINLIDGGSVESLVAWNSSTISMDRGSVDEIWAYDSSAVTINNGFVEKRLYMTDNAAATINGGEVESFATSGNATSIFNGGTINTFLSAVSNGTVTMNGGSVVGIVGALDTGTLTMTGGSIDGYILAAIEGVIYLKGTNFEVNGHALSYGDRLRNFVIGTSDDRYYGTITGVLSDGSVLNNEFQIHNAGEIIIIPEPGTLFLFALGGLVVGRRRTAYVGPTNS